MEDIDGEDEDIDDPDLEAELLGMVDQQSDPPRQLDHPSPSGIPSADSSVKSLLEMRIGQYTTAISNTPAGPKRKRFERQLKTIERQLKSVKSGGSVKEDEIPRHGFNIQYTVPTH